MRVSRWFLTTVALVLWISCTSLVAIAQPRDFGTEAKQILDTTGIEGGLIVHIGCGEGRLTAALHVNDRYVVQGLDTNTGNVDRARRHTDSLGIYGPVSFDTFDGERLPYVGDTVNLVVAEDPRECCVPKEWRISRETADGAGRASPDPQISTSGHTSYTTQAATPWRTIRRSARRSVCAG